MRDEEAANVQGLIDRAALASGRPPLSDQLLANWQAGAGITLTEPNDPGARVTGLAQASPRGEGWTIEVVVDADSDDPRAGKRRLAERVMQAVAEAGGGTTDWWVFDATAEDDRLAGKLGFAIDRDLRQMSRRLPTERSSSVVTRPFVVGQDEEAWLAVNNRAFAGHAEQGGWTIETLRGRFALAWFDPAGFLLHERDGVLARVLLDEAPQPGPVRGDTSTFEHPRPGRGVQG